MQFSVRFCKVALLAACALHWTLVVFNNLVDYDTNFQFVRHVLSMDTVHPANQGGWRSSANPVIHHLAYLGIIAWEILCMLSCWWSAKLCLSKSRSALPEFERAKSSVAVALTLVILLFFGGFITVGGEWFMMWQSERWDGVDTAGRLCTVHLGILLWVTRPEREEERA